MDTRHKRILERMTDIQAGLLRYSSGKQKRSLQVQVMDSSSPLMVQCSFQGGRFPERLQNKPASLSQVTKKGYLHISGTITASGRQNDNAVCLSISQVHWFERNRKSGRPELINFFDK